jgi:hypothetical protein
MYNLFQRKNNWLFFSLLIICQSVFSQSIEELYVKMPDILNPTLSRQNRLELLEYHKAHLSDSTKNRFGNQAYLQIMDTLNKHIVVKNTPTSTFEMKVGYLKDSVQYIGIIRTICAPVCHSTIEFYDTAWNVIPIQFTLPKTIDWVNENMTNKENIDLSWVKKSLEICFISLSFSSEGSMIIAKNNMLEFLSEDDRKIIKPFIGDKVFKYRLQDKQWLREP